MITKGTWTGSIESLRHEFLTCVWRNFVELPLMKKFLILGPLALIFGFSGCQAPAGKAPPLQAMNRHVDLKKFMGDWYVIAHIPTFIETEAYNAVESYQLNPDGSIATTFKFNKGSFDGPLKTYHPHGFIYNHETNAEWRMQFVWPIKSAFLITSLSPDYSTTIIGIPDRKYVWIMARTKTLPAKTYAAMVKTLVHQGYDISKLRRVPQR
jgi:apolipoprotein D and lipocalin family protein